MRAELKELNTDQLRDYVIDLKGIENAQDWKNAKPVTLMELIEEAMANHPEVFWIVEYSEPGDELVEPEVVQIEQKNVQIEQKNVQIEQESAQDEQEAAQNEHEVAQEVTPESEQEPAQEVVQIESESAIVGQESVSIDSAEEAEPEKSSDILSGNWTEYEKPAKHKSISDLGEWAKYRGRALTTSEQNYVIKGMKDEGYSFSVISNVVRLSVPTVSSRYKKMTGNAD